MNQRACIFVFAKHPLAGRAKTRLIPRLGNSGAAELATAFLEDTWAVVSALPWAKPVLASTEEGLPECLPGPVEIWLQGKGDLGTRLENIFRRALGDQSYAIALGADSPGLPAKFLEQARDALSQVDAVIGPCEDGGFKQNPPMLHYFKYDWSLNSLDTHASGARP